MTTPDSVRILSHAFHDQKGIALDPQEVNELYRFITCLLNIYEDSQDIARAGFNLHVSLKMYKEAWEQWDKK